MRNPNLRAFNSSPSNPAPHRQPEAVKAHTLHQSPTHGEDTSVDYQSAHETTTNTKSAGSHPSSSTLARKEPSESTSTAYRDLNTRNDSQCFLAAWDTNGSTGSENGSQRTVRKI
jgi:hypothetical protein